uniref:Uncharacterized protein n=1 Tax=Rhipicephalus microplus TaxID=6941 RepID=A0A6G5AII1_RHIMP
MSCNSSPELLSNAMSAAKCRLLRCSLLTLMPNCSHYMLILIIVFHFGAYSFVYTGMFLNFSLYYLLKILQDQVSCQKIQIIVVEFLMCCVSPHSYRSACPVFRWQEGDHLVREKCFCKGVSWPL